MLLLESLKESLSFSAKKNQSEYLLWHIDSILIDTSLYYVEKYFLWTYRFSVYLKTQDIII